MIKAPSVPRTLRPFQGDTMAHRWAQTMQAALPDDVPLDRWTLVQEHVSQDTWKSRQADAWSEQQAVGFTPEQMDEIMPVEDRFVQNIICPTCKIPMLSTQAHQRRSADEVSDVFIRCSKCGYRVKRT
jgi:DNA-directed RNA polymerase subunit M/transcription elongation factor TFIIS